MLAKILTSFTHRSQIKNMETEFGGNRTVVSILSQWRGAHSGLMPKELCPLSHEEPRGFCKMRLVVRS